MRIDSRRKPGTHRAQLAPKGLPGKRLNNRDAPCTRASATPGRPGGFAVLETVLSKVTLTNKNHGWSASWGWGGAAGTPGPLCGASGLILDHSTKHTVERAHPSVWKIPEGRQAPSGPVTSQPLMRNNKAQVLTGWSGTSNQDSTCPWSAPWELLRYQHFP